MAKRIFVLWVLLPVVLFSGVTFAEKSAVPKSELLKPTDFVSENYGERYLLKAVRGYVLSVMRPTADAYVGSTWYDMQHVSAMPKMVANDYQGESKGQHFTWMEWPMEPPANRWVYYRYNDIDGSWIPKVRLGHAPEMPGYTGLDIFNENYPFGHSCAVLIYHNSERGFPWDRPRRCMIALDKPLPGEGYFDVYDIPDSTETMTAGGMWPHGAIDSCGNIHILTLEGGTTPGPGPLAYIRCTPVEVEGQLLKCEGPGVGPYYVTEDEFFAPDSNMISYLDHTGTISYVVATDVNSEKVALVWTKWTENWPVPDDTSNCQIAQDVWYLESENCGDDWIIAGSFAIPWNITQWKPDDPYTTYSDIAAVYDLNQDLHVFWNAHYLKESTDEYDPYDNVLMHWSKDTERICGNDTIPYTIVASKKLAPAQAAPWAWNRLISKISASVGIEGSIKEGWLFCLWQQFNQNDISASGYSNGEIYFCFSTNDGVSWSLPRNLTNTPSPDCVPGNCESEGWPSLATRVDSFMNIQYVYDTDAGAAVQNEGVYTQNYVMYKKERVDTLTAVALPRIDWSPKEDLVEPWVHVPNNGAKTCSLTITNVGTGTLYVDYISETADWLYLYPSSFSLVEGACPEIIVVEIDASCRAETFLRDSIRVISNDVVGNDDFYIRVNVVVSDEYYEPEFVLVDNGTFQIYESNVGNIGHQREEGQMWFFADEFGPVFDGSVILSTASSPARVGRWIYDEHYMLAETSLTVEDLGWVKIIKSKFCPLNPLPPYFSWWWVTVECQDSILTSSGEVEQSMLERTIKIYKNPPPPWWGYDPSATNPDMYVGMAVDFDLPSNAGYKSNTPGFDSELNVLYQQGVGDALTTGGARFDSVYAGIAYIGDASPYSAHILPNDIYVYPNDGYLDDSLYRVMSTPGFSILDPQAPRIADYNCVMTGTSISGGQLETDTVELKFRMAVSTEGLDTLKNMISSAFCLPGDVYRDGVMDLKDVVYLAVYLYKCYPPPPCFGSADVNGNCEVDIADALYLAYYVFRPWPAPIPYCSDPDDYSDPGYRDTLKLATLEAVPGNPFVIPLSIFNDEPVFVNIPLRIEDTTKLIIDSIVFEGTRGEGVLMSKPDYSCEGTSGIIIYSIYDLPACTVYTFPSGAGIVGYLWGHVKEYANTGFVRIDTSFLEPTHHLRFFKSPISSLVPEVVSGGVMVIYICGDVNADEKINLSDPIYLANYKLKGGPAPASEWAADVNCDSNIDLGDALIIAKYFFGIPGFDLNCCE